MSRPVRTSVLYTVLVIAISACSGGGGGGGTAPPPAPKLQTGRLVKDIHSAAEDRGIRRGGNAVELAGRLYFTASTRATGFELFVTDGTVAGTKLLADIFPGAKGSFPTSLTASNGFLFFSAEDANGRELWRTDGTPEGTSQVKDIVPGCLSSNPNNLVDLNGVLIFSASTNEHGIELWRSDGSQAGTALVRDLEPTRVNGTPRSSSPASLAPVGDAVYFQATTQVSGRELWRTDGTSAGTTLVRDLYPGVRSSFPHSITPFKGRFLFVASTTTGYELWISNGTSQGTSLLRDIRPGSSGSFPSSFHMVGSWMVFSAFGPSGRELYRTDGTSRGTVLVRDINRTATTAGSDPRNFQVLGSRIVFSANDGVNGRELWVSDALSGGTKLLRDIRVGDASSSPIELGATNGLAWFAAYDDARGREIWRTDGTANGTALVADLNSGRDVSGLPKSSGAAALGVLGNRLAIYANNGSDGYEPGFLDGATFTVAPLEPDTDAGSYPREIHSNGVLTLFSAIGSENEGRELFTSDGTADGTELVKDLNVGPESSDPEDFTELGGKVIFRAREATTGNELWITDGTANGTMLLKDIDPRRNGTSPRDSFPNHLVAAGGFVYFSAFSTAGNELWRTDGTASGTRLERDIYPGTTSSSPAHLTPFDGYLYFVAEHPSYGRELWRTDPATGATSMVRDLYPGRVSGSPNGLFVHRDALYMSARSQSSGYELHRVTQGSTTIELVRDIAPSRDSSSPNQLTAVGDVLYFVAKISGRDQLWRTDGTRDGTRLLRSLSSINNLSTVRERLYFSGRTEAEGEELWTSDGTEAGTVLVQDIYAGCVSSSPGPIVTVNGREGWFVAQTAEHGVELWRLREDGVPELARDFLPGPASGVQTTKFDGLFVVNGKVWLSAEDGKSGVEAWIVEQTPVQ